MSGRALHALARRAALTVAPAALAAAVAVSAVPMTVTTEPSGSAATSASAGLVPFHACGSGGGRGGGAGEEGGKGGKALLPASTRRTRLVHELRARLRHARGALDGGEQRGRAAGALDLDGQRLAAVLDRDA